MTLKCKCGNVGRKKKLKLGHVRKICTPEKNAINVHCRQSYVPDR